MILQQFLNLKPGIESYHGQSIDGAVVVTGDQIALTISDDASGRDVVAILDVVAPWVRENVDLPDRLQGIVDDHMARKAAYEGRLEGKADRLRARSERKQSESDALHAHSHEIVSCIPLGQPILVGHHSERGHRRRLDRSWNAMGKAVASGKYADELQSRADRVGSGGISSDDPDGRFKLSEKLEKLQEAQDKMKATNRALKKKSGSDEALRALGFTDSQIAQLRKPDCAGRVGFASYQLTNNNAEIRRLKARIESLAQVSKLEDFERAYGAHVNLELDTADNRVRLRFDDRPSKDVCRYLKRSGFNFSRTNTAWQRKATQNGICAAKSAAEHLAQELG